MKKKSIDFRAIIIALIIGLFSCNSGTEPTNDTTVDTATVNTGGNAGTDNTDSTTNVMEDTSIGPRPVKINSDQETIVTKTAKLGYSYYPKMKHGDTKIIRAYVSINNPESKIRDTLRHIEKMQTVQAVEEDTSTINIINSIPFYKKIKIVIDTTNDFYIKAFKPAQQVIDTLKGNLWLWQITDRTDKRIADITILVDAESPAGVLENIDIREIKIKIEIDKITFVRTAVNYLSDNPAVSIPIVVALVSFIGWLIKYILEKKKAENNKP